MTLLVTILKDDEAIILADRKLSQAQGLTYGTTNKTTCIIAKDAQMLVAFTGLAEIRGSFDTSKWLLDAVHDCRGNGNIEKVVFGFNEYAQRYFLEHPKIKELRPSDKRLTIVGVGHGHDGTPLFFRTSNFKTVDNRILLEASDIFESIRLTGGSNFNYSIYWDGYTKDVIKSDFVSLSKLIQQNRPSKAIVGKCVEIMRDIISRGETKKYVGSDISVTRLPCGAREFPISSYYPANIDDELPLSANIVDITNETNKFAIADIKFTSSDGMNVVAPSVSRNAPCPCGSGKKYKRCHGKI